MRDRDKRIISFIQTFGAVDSNQVYKLFFSELSQGLHRAQDRLTAIVEAKEYGIKRKKVSFLYNAYIYYEKDAQLLHKYLITEFYLKLHEGPGTIREFENHITVGNMRPDFFCAYQVGDRVVLIFGEVQISANPLNLKKYTDLKESGVWEKERRLPFPDLVVITDRRVISDPRLKMFVIGTDFKGWEKILKD